MGPQTASRSRETLGTECGKKVGIEGRYPKRARLTLRRAQNQAKRRGIHQIHNILIELKQDGAAVESYFSAFQRQLGAERQMQQWDMKGRYLDWFVERDGEWRVLNRTVVFDWVEEMPLPNGSEAERFGPRTPIGGPYPDDLVYSMGPIA